MRFDCELYRILSTFNDETHHLTVPAQSPVTLLPVRPLTSSPPQCPQVPGVQQFIAKEQAPKFIDPPPFDMKGCYADSKCFTPLIFVLTPGESGLCVSGCAVSVCWLEVMSVSITRFLSPSLPTWTHMCRTCHDRDELSTKAAFSQGIYDMLTT